jgi:hypothetical protein
MGYTIVVTIYAQSMVMVTDHKLSFGTCQQMECSNSIECACLVGHAGRSIEV